MNDPNAIAWYTAAHTLLANLFLLAKSNPSAIIDGPSNNNMTASQLLQMVQNITLRLTTAAVIGDANYDRSSTISIDVDGLNTSTYVANWGDTARSWTVLHEIGHIDTRGHGAQEEAYANTVGLGIANMLGVAYLNPAQLNLVGGLLPQ